MAVLIDSYSESNWNYQIIALSGYSAFSKAVGQSFTGDGGTLNSAKFYVNKTGSPTGNATAKIYAHTGTFGTSSVPTGAALATSDNVDVSSITTSLALITFTFSGANKITLTDGTYYVVTIEYSGGNLSNRLGVGTDYTSPTHSGNSLVYVSSWTANNSEDTCFYVYGDDPPAAETLTVTASAKARIKDTGVTKTIQAKADVKKLATTKTVQSKANINGLRVGGTTLVSPDHIGSGTSPVVFVWEIATNSLDEPVHSQIQIDDTSSAFGSLEIDQKSWEDNTGMEYWNGSSWVEYPLTGVTSAYFGNQARLTVALTDTQKWWRVRGASG